MSSGHSKPKEWLRANPKARGEADKGAEELALPLGLRGRDKDREGTQRWQGWGVPVQSATNTSGMSRTRSTAEEHKSGGTGTRGTLSLLKSPAFRMCLDSLLPRNSHLNGPCSLVCAEGLHPPEFPSPITANWIIQAGGSEEMGVQNPVRTLELIKVEEAWL